MLKMEQKQLLGEKLIMKTDKIIKFKDGDFTLDIHVSSRWKEIQDRFLQSGCDFSNRI